LHIGGEEEIKEVVGGEVNEEKTDWSRVPLFDWLETKMEPLSKAFSKTSRKGFPSRK